MNYRFFLRIIFIIIIVIGGIIIIIFPPVPEPICIVCGQGLGKLLGISQIVLGAVGLFIENKIFNVNKR
ncbi:hypothetical protein [Flavobacterium sp.]|jgi:hypothetical protein|uniref:hypothetical protein n=1 Tax=Flavobacterium sp. TaxID=239 RepID=UPI0038FD2E34